MITIRVEFNNDVECILDEVEKYELTKDLLKVKFNNGYVRKFDRKNIKDLEKLKNG